MDFDELSDQIILEDETKTFHFSCDVHYLDNEFLLERKIGYNKCKVNYNNPIPVVGTDGKIIGAATLSFIKNLVIADIIIDYSTPDRLSIQAGHKIYPHLEQSALCADTPWGNMAIEMIPIKVILSLYPTNDPRIGEINV